MRSILKNKDKRGVFGLNSVQAFFAIIIVVALIGYIIIVVMGTLEDTKIAGYNDADATSFNETVTVFSANANTTTVSSARSVALRNIRTANASDGATIEVANFTVVGADFTLIAGTVYNGTEVTISATADYKENQTRTLEVSRNVSQGPVDFFSNLSSAWTVLAVLVIILILIVLVRVVGGGTGKEGGL